MPSSPTSPLTAVVVLAAGQGTRMKSTLPKVLHQVAGRSLLDHVLHAAAGLNAQNTIVVVGHGRELVTENLATHWPQAITATQTEQNGTGHAVAVALESVAHVSGGNVLVLAGDTPLLTSEDLASLSTAHSGAAATILTARLANPFGYGRIVRDADGTVNAIVEERDATDAQRSIDEVNSGVYIFDLELLRDALTKIGSSNDQGEQYLTDVIGVLRAAGHIVRAAETHEAHILGVNDRRQLATAGAVLRERINDSWMLAGVTMIDPATVWIDSTVTIETDAVILPNVMLTGATTVAARATVGPDCTLHDTAVGPEASVVRTTAHSAVIGDHATVGPYTYLRPGTVLGAGAKAGGFVEMKNAQLGEGAKVPHLSYVGDATIGEGTNIGAATVFVNYDGVEKHHTTIGRHVRVGSDSMLVAPITIGDGAYTAAGSVITENVPAGAMAVARARQRNIVDWVVRRRPGTKSAQAAVADSTHTNGSGEGA